MRRTLFALLFVCAPVTFANDSPPASTTASIAPSLWDHSALRLVAWRHRGAIAQPADASAKDAFEASRELGTVEAWNAFLASYPRGFYADLARAYLKKLQEQAGFSSPVPTVIPQSPAPAPSSPPAAASSAPPPAAAPMAPPPTAAAPVAPAPAPVAAPAAPPAPSAPARAAASAAGNTADVAPTDPNKPAVARGATYMGFAERFNRYYTDPNWKASRVVYVSPNGNGDGTRRDTPMSPRTAIAAARPGTQIVFTRGAYNACFEFPKQVSGTYEEPIVVYGERNPDRSLGVAITCCNTGRQVCFNLEGSSHIAIDGFEMIGGRYGVRAIGEGYPASQHSSGIAVIDNNGHDQDRDPFFSGQVDWAVWERNVAYGAKAGDGHGIYLSNGGDWNIVRYNETFSNVSSDFQINADPDSTCKQVGIAFNDPRCDAYAGTGEGGQGASDYFLVDSNYFHHGIGNGSGPNFTSVRRSVVRNNIFGFYNNRHGVSFWQETDNPKLGSSENKIANNLFVTTNRHAVKFEAHSTRNEFTNNVLVGVRINGANVAVNPSALLMEVDGTVGENVYRSNMYIGGRLEGRTPNGQELVRPDFFPGWFTRFPAQLNRDPNDFRPTPGAPMLGVAPPSRDAPTDRFGAPRPAQADLGPIEVR